MGIFEKINWKVRFRNKVWVMGFVGALFVLASAVLNLFGIHVNFANVEQNVYAVVEALFGVLVVIGVVTDGTTSGAFDSAAALTYEYPKPNVMNENAGDDEDKIIDQAIAIEDEDDEE